MLSVVHPGGTGMYITKSWGRVSYPPCVWLSPRFMRFFSLPPQRFMGTRML